MESAFKHHTNRWIYLFFAFLLLQPSSGLASVNISVIPTDGGSSLRFGKAELKSSPDKQVTVRINSSENKQYQIFQRIIEPFVNERGESLNRSVLTASSQPGSNGKGTLYLQNLEPLSFADQLVYTSNATGDSDAFTLFYKVNADQINFSGNFTGRIIYSIRTVGSNTQSEVVLSIFLQSDPELKIETRTAQGNDTIRLDVERGPAPEDYYQIKYENNSGQDLKIYQEVIDPPVNEAGDALARDTILFMTSSVNFAAGTLFGNPSILERGRKLIYSAQNTEETVSISFHFDQTKLSEQKAGNYHGKIKYNVTGGNTVKNYDVNLEIIVPPIFKLELNYPQGGLNFLNLLPEAPPQIKEVDVMVKTNLGKPYAIHQNVSGPLTNDNGRRFDSKYFLMRQEIADGVSGKLLFPDLKPVPNGEVPMFYSDNRGSPIKFKVFYQQRPYPEMEAGTYQTTIGYTLLQI